MKQKNILKLEDDGFCFVCGKNNPDGLRLDFRKIDNKVVAEFYPSKKFQGYKDIIHGGIITTILDEAMVKACIMNGINAVTAEINVRFLRALLTGNSSIVEAWIVSQNPKLIEAESVLKDMDNNILARGRAKLIPHE